MNRRLISLDEVSHRKQEYLWGGRIPVGALTVLDGMPGDAKSLVTYDVAARLTSGHPLPGCDQARAPCGVVLLQGEDDARSVVKPRLLAAGADPTRVRVLDQDRFAGNPLVLPKDIPLVETAIAEIGAKLMVIDPLSMFIEKSTSNEREMRRLLSPLVELAERKQVGIVAVRHFTKGASSTAMYRGAGSVAIVGLARAGLLVGPDPGSQNQFCHAIAQFKSNLGHTPALRYETVRNRDEVLTVEWLGECDISAAELLRGIGGPEQRTQLEEAKYVLYSLSTSNFGFDRPESARPLRRRR